MPGATPRGYVYPLPTEPAAGSPNIEALARAIDTDVTNHARTGGHVQAFASAAARDAAIPSPTPGMQCYLNDKKSLQYVDATNVWRRYLFTAYPTLAAPSAVPGNSNISITFPVGAFGAPPATVATANSTGASAGFAFVGSASTTATTVYWHQLAGAAASRTVYLIVTPREDVALAREQIEHAGPEMTVTCPTDGCENQGVPLSVPVADAAQCGPCGTDITASIVRDAT